MADRYENAQLLTALWKLGGVEGRMPTSHGILDRALYQIRSELPPALRDGLSFSNTGVGLRCFELPAILLAAQETLLTSEPNPTYLSTAITIDEDAARQIVVGADLSTREARAIGGKLREAVDHIRSQMGSSLEPIAA
jgi:hypothetical protein